MDVKPGRILKIRWPMKVSNLEMRQCAGIASTISQQVRRRRWKFIGHVLRSDDEHTKVALKWTPQGRHNKGRPGGEQQKGRGRSWVSPHGVGWVQQPETEQSREPSSTALLSTGTKGNSCNITLKESLVEF